MTHINNNKKREILTNKEKNLFFLKKMLLITIYCMKEKWIKKGFSTHKSKAYFKK
jgi:hypothetical protein